MVIHGVLCICMVLANLTHTCVYTVITQIRTFFGFGQPFSYLIFGLQNVRLQNQLDEMRDCLSEQAANKLEMNEGMLVGERAVL